MLGKEYTVLHFYITHVVQPLWIFIFKHSWVEVFLTLCARRDVPARGLLIPYAMNCLKGC